MRQKETNEPRHTITCLKDLRIPDSYDAKIAKICNLWTFWPVIKLLAELQARMSRDADLAIFAS